VHKISLFLTHFHLVRHRNTPNTLNATFITSSGKELMQQQQLQITPELMV